MIETSPRQMERVFLYGPPGSGKSSLGRQLAQDLSFSFIDLDQVITQQAGMPIEQIFETEAETGFRQRESQALRENIQQERCVIALGGGALLRAENRGLVAAHGQVLCLSAPVELLLLRLTSDEIQRPLIAGDAAKKLERLIDSRRAHYASFALQLDSSKNEITELSRQAQCLLGLFRVTGMQTPYDVRVSPGGLAFVGDWLRINGLAGPVAVVTDENVAKSHLQPVLDSLQAGGYEAHPIRLPAGESHKTMETIQGLWSQFLQVGLERSSTVLALGGGVVGDLAGFAAATYLRGVNWVAIPTSLLAMVDASLGGKTGADLPQGKNLVGAFHAPRLVLVDPLVLQTLPEVEIRNGMAEVIKHGVINDPGLLELCELLYLQGVLPGKVDALGRSVFSGKLPPGEALSAGRALNKPTTVDRSPGDMETNAWSDLEIEQWTNLVRRAMAVKIQVILEDPFETDRRASLNLGHTLGHAIEQVSGYQVRHGEAVAIGTMAVLNASVRLGLADSQFQEALGELFDMAGLPIEIPPDLAPEALFAAMSFDKKRKGGKLRFVLPVRPGEVQWGIEIPDFGYLLAGD